MNTVQTGIGWGMNSFLGKCIPLPKYRRIDVIKSFADKKLKALWETGNSRIDSRFHGRILRRLDILNSATNLETLKLSNFNFHGLHGYNPKRYSIHVNGPRCITFEFRDGDAYAVDFVQYH